MLTKYGVHYFVQLQEKMELRESIQRTEHHVLEMQNPTFCVGFVSGLKKQITLF